MTTLTLHPLLRRQLERLRLDGDAQVAPTLAEWRALLESVSATYEQAAQDHAVHEALIEASPEAIIIVSNDRRVASYNRRFADLWSIPADVLATRDANQVLAAGTSQVTHADAFVARVRHLNEHLDESSRDEVIELVDGRIVERDSSPVVTESGSFCGRVWFFRDVTERRRAEARVREMKETAERAARAKSDFLRNMSHEMRTPLNAILGFARVLRRSAGSMLSDEQKGYLQDIVQAGGYMLQLVNDLLDLRSLEEGKLLLTPVALEPLIAQSVALVRPLVHDKQLELTLAVPVGLPNVLGDRRAIVQILVNLLSNAGKFTAPGGSVAVSAALRDRRVEVAVQDTGEGIAKEDQERLFVYFEQLGGRNAAHMKGSGVGLALTRSLVERQGGTIAVESTIGKGSTFRFWLEAAP